jgi:hypothetical protein|tara:strand:+ start:208 stop:525 length:318 start_codon:yes stop_codon:yes gene_type:complete
MSEWLKKPPYELERVKSEQKRRSNLLASGENLKAWSKARGLTLTEGKKLLRENYRRSPKIGTLNRLIKRKLVQSNKNKVKWKNVGGSKSALIHDWTNKAIPKVLE